MTELQMLAVALDHLSGSGLTAFILWLVVVKLIPTIFIIWLVIMTWLKRETIKRYFKDQNGD